MHNVMDIEVTLMGVCVTCELYLEFDLGKCSATCKYGEYCAMGGAILGLRSCVGLKSQQ